MKGEEYRNLSIDNISDGEWIVHCDAGYDYKTAIAGISIIIKKNGKEYRPKDLNRRARGPIHAELLAVYHALKEMNAKKGDKRIIKILTDCLYCYYFLDGRWLPSRDYIVGTMQNIWYETDALEKEGAEVQFIHVAGKVNKRVDRRAKKARKAGEADINKKIEDRIMKIEECLHKGMGIQIEEIDGEYFALSSKADGTKYKVDLYPPSCECPAWNKKWKNVPEYGRRARRLPCKHICALAIYLDEDIFKIFEKQIWRKN